MANINDIFTFITDVLERKERLAFTTATQINSALDRASKELFTQYAIDYGKTEKLHDALAPFKMPGIFINADTPNGVLTLPPDYQFMLNFFVIVFDNVNQKSIKKKVVFVNEDEYNSAVNSQVRPVSPSRPVGITVGKTLVLEPAISYAGNYTYLRAPVAPVWAFTQVGRVVTYDPGNSVQLEWSELYWSNIIAKALEYLGINLAEGELVQFGQVKESQTP